MSSLPSNIAELKKELTSVLEKSTSFEESAFEILFKAFAGESDFAKHGPILWALMETTGSPATIDGFKFTVYIQYYYLALIFKRKNRPITRALSVSELGFLTAVAAHGLSEGSKKYDAAYAKGDISVLHNMTINEATFLAFFSSPNLVFNFYNSLKIIDKLYFIWIGHPQALVGFITPQLSSYKLNVVKSQVGSFLFRFNSSGGLSADFINSKQEIVSNPIAIDILGSPLSFTALIQRSNSLKLFLDIDTEKTIPKSEVLVALKKAASFTEKQVLDEIDRWNKANPKTDSKSTTPKIVVSTPVKSTPTANPTANPVANQVAATNESTNVIQTQTAQKVDTKQATTTTVVPTEKPTAKTPVGRTVTEQKKPEKNKKSKVVEDEEDDEEDEEDGEDDEEDFEEDDEDDDYDEDEEDDEDDDDEDEE